jgi:hypothetical protein
MESKKYQVFVDPSADGRLAAHIEFLARVSENAAVRLYKDYEEALRFLENSPKGCPLYTPNTPIDAELRYKLFGKRYKIIFEIAGSTVYAYDIQDCRQNLDKNLL